MRLRNFSVGRVQTVRIGTSDIQTAHVKSPAAEPWMITEQGAQGDERAVHPDKIYAYARTGYEYWATQLHCDSAAWPDGFFGENLTFDVLDEAEIRLGDVFALGNEVRLIAAGPRNPCLKLSWRLGQPPTFQKIFQQSGHTGVYFDILAPGRVRPGDTAVLLERASGLPSIVETARLAAGHAIPPLEPLRRVLSFAHLSKTLRHILQAKLGAAERQSALTESRWSGWRPFVLDRIEREAADIRSFYLKPKDGGPLCPPRPGQFVTVRFPDADSSLTRCWSLSSHADPSLYRLTVRKQSGAGSTRLHSMELGSEVWLRAPAGNFTLDLGGYRPVVLVAAGIGITPLLAMLHAQLARGNTGTPVFLIYGARSKAEMAFRDEIERLASLHPQLHIAYVFSRETVVGCRSGRITATLVREALSDNHVFLGDRRIALPWHENDTYLCGPGEFCARIKTELTEAGANPDHIFHELFATAPTQETELQLARVRFARSGVECDWLAEEDLSLLEVGERAGVKLESDCRAGACFACRTRVIDGEVTGALSDRHALLCIGRPRTSVVVLDR